jgi:O-antigen ligase
LLAGSVVLATAADLPFVESAAAVLPWRMQTQLVTLTGRTQVWRETLYLWKQNLLFGYGPGLWDLDMRTRYRELLQWAPPSAHNQIYETIGQSGLVGLAGLGVYVIALVGAALRLGARAPAATVFVAVLIVRGATEPTFAGGLDAGFIVHFLAFAFVVLASKHDALALAAARPRAPSMGWREARTEMELAVLR